MKLTTLSTAILGATLVLAQAAHASDGTITIRGAITSSTCSIDIDGSGSSSATVTLPTVSVNALNGVGKIAGLRSFRMRVYGSGTTCAAGTNVNAYFDGGLVDMHNGNLYVDGTSTATNVEVQIVDSKAQPIFVSRAGTPITQALVASGGVNETTLVYGAQYIVPAAINNVAVTSGATAGSVNTYVTYSINYN